MHGSEARILPFIRTADPEYQAHLDRAIEDADELAERLLLHALNLAAAGRWREWDKTVEAGGVAAVEPGDLQGTGDPLVTLLAEEWNALQGIIERLSLYSDYYKSTSEPD